MTPVAEVAEKELADVRRVNTAPSEFDPERDLPQGFMEFLLPLHRELTPGQQAFITRRSKALESSQRGRKPVYLEPSEAPPGD
jgi:hypothetical protein